MKRLNKDARSFVDGIVDQMKKNYDGDRPFPKVQTFLRKVSEQAWKEHTAKITTAVSLNQQEKEYLSEILSKRMNQEITLECSVRADILGGIRIEIADYIIDMSYEEKLRSIQSLFLK
jgi:ATP synthase F1 delta subunit